MKKTLSQLSPLLFALAMPNQAAAAPTVNYAIDSTHTFVTYEIDHLGASTSRGRFDLVEGQIQWDKVAKKGRMTISIDTKRVNTGVPALDKHMHNADFFNVQLFPVAKFTSETFRFDGDKVQSVEGELTMLGKTLPVTLSSKRFSCYQHPLSHKEVCGGDFEATIDRSQWGMTYAIDAGLIPKEVHLVIQVEAVKQ